MASQSNELMSPRVIPSNYVQPDHEVLDLGAYKQLNAEIVVLTAGTGGAGEKIVLQTAAVNEENRFQDVPTMEAVLNNVATVHVTTDQFMRYVRARANGVVTGTPVVTITTIGKE